jgi:glycosyltransferase AglE
MLIMDLTGSKRAERDAFMSGAEVVQPMVSVIVPVYQGERHIGDCIRSVLAQDYPSGRFEVIVVDNGSTDASVATARAFDRVRVLIESETRSSYAARNRGIRNASGEILAFLDSDCVAEPNWLRNAVHALNEQAAELIGGCVVFDYGPHPTGAELYDSMTNMQIERNVQERGIAKTANLVVRRRAFDQVGEFPGSMASGGDVAWTSHATRSGLNLIYSAEARVHHPARRLGALMKKQFRVGRGQPRAWMLQGRSRLGFLRSIARTIRPTMRPQRIRNELERLGVQPRSSTVARTWVAGALAGLATGIGNLASLYKLLEPNAGSSVIRSRP